MAKPTDLNRIWASSAAVADIVKRDDDDWESGFGLEIPHFQELNEMFNRLTGGLDHINRNGYCEWDSQTTYEINNRCLYGGFKWKAINQNTDASPGSTLDWTIDDGHAVGDIMMVDANSTASIDGVTLSFGHTGPWVDDSTKPGWYACVAENSALGVPNLVNKFVQGKEIVGAASFDGSDDVVLSESSIPAHTHPFETVLDGINTGHTHDSLLLTSARIARSSSDDAPAENTITMPDGGEGDWVWAGGYATAASTKNQYRWQNVGTTTDEDTHTHAVSEETDLTGAGSPLVISPEQYSVILIMKVR